MRKRDKLYTIARKTNTEEAWSKFKACRKCVKQRVRKAHSVYKADFLEENIQENPKAFWNYIKSLKQDSTSIASVRHQGVLTSDPKEKAEALGDQFSSVFTKEDLDTRPTLGNPVTPPNSQLHISVAGVAKQLSDLNPNKATGPDGLHPRLLKTVSTQIAPVLQSIFTQSLATGDVPEDWRSSNISPIFRKGDKSLPSNYRPVSLTSVSPVSLTS
ncbi:uncharacterized protein LOC144867713 [Branchiostoma floridae x Branchiostoma japonicum]